MKNFIVFSVLALLGFNTFSQTDWVSQYSGTSKKLYDVQFINDTIGWACGDRIMVHTIDGGENWVTQDTLLQGRDIYFVDSNTGYKVNYTKLYKTTDGGESWNINYTIPGNEDSFHDIFFTDSLRGWAVGGYFDGQWSTTRFILHTNNGGDNWSYQYYSSGDQSLPIVNIQFTDSLNGFAVASHNDLFVTTDGGTYWDHIDPWPGKVIFIHDLFFLNETTGWIRAEIYIGTHILMHTTDGCNSWDIDTLSMMDCTFDFAFIDENRGWIVGDCWTGKIFSTNDGGDSWTEDIIPDSTRALYGIHISESQQVWAVGKDGKILTCLNHLGLTEPQSKSIVKIFPNPVSSRLNINIESVKSNYIQISFINLLGQIIYNTQQSTSAGSLQTSIETSNLTEGMYLLVIDQQRERIVKKVIVHR